MIVLSTDLRQEFRTNTSYLHQGPVTMTSRVMLLAVSISLFVAVWSSDNQQPRRGFVVQLAEQSRRNSQGNSTINVLQRQGIQSGSHEISAKSKLTDDLPIQVDLDETNEVVGGGELAEIPFDDNWMFGGCDTRLPDGISAGRYRVVSSNGEIRNLTLNAADIVYHEIQSDSAPRDLYILTERDERWYFIRLRLSRR